MSNLTANYRADLDGIRAIAVLAVIFFHAHFVGFEGGFIGVDIFFVLSGYLITKHLVDELTQTHDLSFTRFYARRFKRLLPAIIFLIIVVTILWSLLFWNLLDDSEKVFKSIRYSVWGLANIFFNNLSGGYFSSASDEMPFLHFWSLAVEEQFYLAWPILLYIATKIHSKNRPNSQQLQLYVGLIIILSFSLAVTLVDSNRKDQAFYSMAARAWELGLGAFLVFAKQVKFPKKVFEVTSVVGLLLIIFSILQSQYWTFPGLGAIPPTIGTCLLIYTGERRTAVSLFLGNKLFVFIGTISYGWYLWHWPLFAMLKVYNFGEVADLSYRLIAIALSGLMAYFSLKFIEKPIRFSDNSLLNGKHAISLSVCSIFIISIFTFLLSHFQTNNIRDQETYARVKKRTRLLKTCVDVEKNMGAADCTYSSIKNETTAKYAIHTWGDSFSYSLFPLVEQYIDVNGGKGFLYSNSGAPPFLDVPGLSYDTEENTHKMSRISKYAINRITDAIHTESEKKHSVILATYWLYYLPVHKIRKNQNVICITKDCELSNSISVMKMALKTTLKSLNDRGVHKTLIIKPWVEFRYPIARCLALNMSKCNTGFDEMEKYSKDVSELIDETAKQFKNVRTVDPLPFLCNKESCTQLISDSKNQTIPIVFDDAHPSVDGARYFGRHIDKDLNWLVK